MLNVSDPICANPPVATPSRPYLMQVFAVSGWRLGTQKGSYVVTLSRPYLAKIFPSPATRNGVISLLHLCTGRRPVCALALPLLVHRAYEPLGL
jgi:hypothetical protein